MADLKKFLTPEVIAAVAESAGESKEDTKRVLTEALPQMAAAFEKTSSTEKGAASIKKALEEDAEKAKNPTRDKGSLLGSGLGSALLRAMLGGSSQNVASSVSQAANTQTSSTNNILSALAPLLLASLLGNNNSQQAAPQQNASQGSGLGLLSLLLGGGSQGSSASQASQSSQLSASRLP